MRVLDVGCGPGGLTGELAGRVGTANVAAIDPAPQFTAACRDRNPGADVREGVAEELPWANAEFDAALCSLVLGFMRDPDQGVRELARVTRPGGTVAACMWDTTAGGMTMLRTFWTGVRQLTPDAKGERLMAGTAEGDIVERFERAGLKDVVGGALAARGEYAGFDDFWEPFTLAVGPAGQYLRSLSAEQRADVRKACRARCPMGRSLWMPAPGTPEAASRSRPLPRASSGRARAKTDGTAAIYPAGLELVRVGIHWVGSAGGMSGYSGTTLSARVSAGRPDTSGAMSFMASSMRTEEAI